MTEDEVVENVMLVKQAVKEFVPEEAIAEMALLLAKDSSTTISGTTFVWMVDGVHNKLRDWVSGKVDFLDTNFTDSHQ